MSAHTPGPWHPSTDAPRAKNPMAMVIAGGVQAIDVTGSGNTHAESCANARLIAAAPDLLDALRELVSRCDGAEGVRADGSNIQTMRARAAIAKAEGES